jgi:hypothetical protein
MAQNEREEKAKVSGKSIGKLTVDLDTSDAVTALKALQRHARETTKVLREVEEAAKQPDIAVMFGDEKIGIASYDGDVRVDQRYVSDLTTQELADELARREGVNEYSDLILREVKPGEPLDFSDVSKVIVVNRD